MRELTHRRDFVRTLALGASAGVLVKPAPLGVDEPDKNKSKDDKPSKDKPGEAGEEPKTEVDARMELVLTRFGKQLDDEARKVVRSEVESIVRRAESLRKFSLTNGDGPYPIFKPFREPLA